MALTDSLASYFGFEEHGTTLRTEVVAGLTTFLTMSYIVVVNPAILGAAISVQNRTDAQTAQMLAVVTLISAAVATLIMALYARRPFAQAPGLGLNAFFAFTVVLGLGVPWQTALAAVVVEGLLFIVLTAVGAREYVIRLFPQPVKMAVGAGIGLFLAIIGLEAMRVVASDPATYIQFSTVFAQDPVAIVAVVGLFFTFALYARGVPGSIVIGILATTVLGWVASLLGYTAYAGDLPDGGTHAAGSLAPSTAHTYTAAGYDITPLAGAFIAGFGNVDALQFSLIVFTFFFVDFFDTAGTLTGVSQIAGFLDENGNLPDIDRPLMADAIGTTVGGMLGTSTVTTYIESASDRDDGARRRRPLRRLARVRPARRGRPAVREPHRARRRRGSDAPEHRLRRLGRLHERRTRGADGARDALHLLHRLRHRRGHRLLPAREGRRRPLRRGSRRSVGAGRRLRALLLRAHQRRPRGDALSGREAPWWP